MFKEFFMKKMLKAKGVPEGQVDMVMKLVNDNPELFQKIAQEVKEEMASGKDQMAATMAVMQRYEGDVKKAMGL